VYALPLMWETKFYTRTHKHSCDSF
jgi:hypothetical protein